jgi:tetratricopeptide (TPR) repeat protein
MNKHFPPKFIIIAIATLYVLCFARLSLAQELKVAALTADISGVKLEQAREYRELGLGCQQAGNLTQALSFYQKAVAIYPKFGPTYNDIGVVYEALGLFEDAEENYQKAIKMDPLYSSTYTNLALFYESQRDFEKAAIYWGKRVEMGDQDDPWTQKAANRLRDIRSSLSTKPFADEREEEVLGLMKDIAENKTEFKPGDKNIAQAHFKAAKISFDRGNLALAIKEALDAQYLDENNPEIEEFIEKAERRALTR